MARLHIARSEFFDPILELKEDVHLVAPYALPKLIGTKAFRLSPGNRGIPWLWDGERWLTLVDHRLSPFGQGGKYYTINRFGRDPHPEWKGNFVCPLLQ